jgi:mono/diheme cytochrome c family protein
MKNITIYLLLVLSVVALYGFAYAIADNDEPAGKKLFIDNKCNMCHTVKLVGIESKKSDASDIKTLDKEKSTEFWMQYLMKKEKLNGKDHKTAFKGSEEDLAKIVEWLLTIEEIKEKENK